MESIQPYDLFRKLADGLSIVDGDWYDSPFRRRMTLMGLSGGRLMVHNAFHLRNEDYGKISQLGKVAYIVVPNQFHSSEPDGMKHAFPNSKLLISPDSYSKLPAGVSEHGMLPDLPADIQGDVECLEFLGTRIIREMVFLHKPSRTLVLTDLAFNMDMPKNGLQRFFFKLNALGDGFGPSNLCKHLFINNRNLAQQSYEQILKWNFDRIIVNHGRVVESGGHAAFKEAFSFLNR